MKCKGMPIQALRLVSLLAILFSTILLGQSTPGIRQPLVPKSPAASGLPGVLNHPAVVAGIPDNQLVANFGKLPLSFEANSGQVNGAVKFLARGQGYTLFLTGGEAVLTMRKPLPADQKPDETVKQVGLDKLELLRGDGMPIRHDSKTAESTRDHDSEISAVTTLRLQLVGSNSHTAVTGFDELPGKSNYFVGNDPQKWRTNVPTYAKVKYEGIYSGIDLVYYGNQSGQLEYDFVIAPGADPKQIRLSFAGADRMRVDPASGDLLLKIGEDEMRLHKPVVYQPAGAADDRQSAPGESNTKPRAANPELPSGAFVLESNNQLTFRVAGYDPGRALVIDPVLTYSTYLGGSKLNVGNGIAIDASGEAYIAGYTSSTDFPTFDPLQSYGSGPYKAFVTKFNAAGSALVYSTYLGGNNQDIAYAIAVDSSGNAYVTGQTTSTNFPTVNPFQRSIGGSNDGFVTKLNPAGSALVYSTYLGGSGVDYGDAIAVDSSGSAYITGLTASSNFPTENPFQANLSGTGGYTDAFVTKFNAAGSALVYSTYLGGSVADQGLGITVDSSDNAYVTGYTNSTNFPTLNPFQATNKAPDGTAFVTKFDAAGSALVYSTYLGGNGYDYGDRGYAIAVDSSGEAYVTGVTGSTNFPTVNPFQGTFVAGEYTAFVTKFNNTGSDLVYSTYLGGNYADWGYGIAVDSSGEAYVTGTTQSTNFPTVNPIQANIAGSEDIFVTEFNDVGSALIYSTYLGGSISQGGLGIAIDSSGDAYITGGTFSTDFPTVNPFQATCHGCAAGYGDAFALKISSSGGGAALTLSPATLKFANQAINTTSAPKKVTLTSTGTTNLSLSSIAVTGTDARDFAQTNNCPATLVPGAKCTVSLTYTPSALGAETASLTVTDNASGSPQDVSLSGTGESQVKWTPASLTFTKQALETTSTAKTVTVTNDLPTALSIISITRAGADPGDFAQTNTCGSSVAAKGKCIISVTFTPQATGTRTATLNINDSANNSPQTVALTGTGEEQVTWTPTSLTFASLAVGTTSAAKNITLTNNLPSALSVGEIVFTGTDTLDFAQTNTCGSSVAAKGKCTISVTFTPQATGTRTATLNINDGANNSPQTVSLTGTGK
ncbi:MAG: SBBP repeat-containing protein [Terriglobales bacterium]